MALGESLKSAILKLNEAGIDNAAYDARILLQEATGLSHAQIIGSPEKELNLEQVELFAQFIEKRLAHMPLGRILGAQEFYGREFGLNQATLEPRADTEVLIEITKELFERDAQLKFADIGTGTGAIAITTALEFSQSSGIASDISADALAKAKQNAAALSANNLEFIQGDCWEPFAAEADFDLIISNPPYIQTAVIEALDKEVSQHDPMAALDGGADGLEFYRIIIGSAELYLKPSGYLLLEIGYDQAEQVKALIDAEPLLAFMFVREDLSSMPRAVLCKKTMNSDN